MYTASSPNEKRPLSPAGAAGPDLNSKVSGAGVTVNEEVNEEYPGLLQNILAGFLHCIIICFVCVFFIRRKTMKTLDDYIRVIPDFPEPGVMFRDITTVFQDADGMKLAIDQMQDAVKDLDFDVIVGAESRGFIYGAAMAYNLHKPLVLVRKKGKLPWKTESVDYDLEYGKATLEIHIDAIKPGQRVLLVDDLLATGGTVKAGAELIEKLGGVVAGILVMIELKGLEGRKKLEGYRVDSVIAYDGK